MGFLLGLLPFIQVVSLLFAGWGLINAKEATDVVITYGVSGDDGFSLVEFLKSYGSVLLGGVGYAASYIFQKNQNLELIQSALAWWNNRNNVAAQRRALFAVVDFLETLLANAQFSEEFRKWLNETFAQLRTAIANLGGTIPVSKVTS